MEIPAVGLEVDDSALLEEVTVTVHEQRGCKALLLTTDLRIRKGYPDFRNLSGSEQGFDELDTCT